MKSKVLKFDAEKFSARFACEVKDFDAMNFLDKKEARRMGAFAHFAIAASDEAMTHSGLVIDESNADDFSLEVSSPGLDEPLKLLRQYKKNVGREVEVITSDDVKKEGKLTEVTEEKITIEYTEGKGKKSVLKADEIFFTDIKQTKVQIKF